MSDQDSASKYARKGVLRKTEAAPSKSNQSAMTPPIQSRFATNTKTERLKAKKKEIFHTEMKNLGQLKNFLDKNFTWCQEFSEDEFLSKDEKISLFELTILINQTIGHMKILQDALHECKKSSEYWEDLFDTISEHFDDYMQFYIQYLSTMDSMQETVKRLQEYDHMKSVFNDSWLGKENYEFERVLTYPRDRLLKLKSITEEARTILMNMSEGKTISVSDNEELKGCERALSIFDKILATDTSSKSDIVLPKRYRSCRVIHSLRPSQADELRLKENDIIEIISKNRNGWWQGRLQNKKVGWFPGNYVEELDDGGSSHSGSTDSTEKAGSSDEDGNYHIQSSSSKTNKTSNSSTKPENDDTLVRLQRQLSDADEARASAEARVQELIMEAQRAKAEAEARAEQIKKVLKSRTVEQRASSHSSTDSEESDPENGDDDRDNEDDGDDNEEDEYAADRADIKHSMRELDELAAIATGSESRTMKAKKTCREVEGADHDDYEDLECYFCKKVIETYVPKEGKTYCPSCYDDLFTKKCFKCKKPITGSGLTYKEKPWHSDCFTCTHCEVPIAGEKFISREDKPHCADCFGEKFAKRCTGCLKPIIGDNGMSFITSGGRSWHNECFVCTSCHDTLIGRGFFFTKEDNIVCPGCD